tara:strand:+ start:450 stop:845 length:396 start_codon:yes stop_codon:yes gene_type:complete
MDTQLLCTFAKKNELDSIVNKIKSTYDVVFKKIYVFQNEDKSNEFICTYNVNNSDVDYNAIENTISLHRKKHTNTLYTINALNELIKNMNNGVLDIKFKVPWENFRNMLLVINKDGLNRISTRIYRIDNFE